MNFSQLRGAADHSAAKPVPIAVGLFTRFETIGLVLCFCSAAIFYFIHGLHALPKNLGAFPHVYGMLIDWTSAVIITAFFTYFVLCRPSLWQAFFLLLFSAWLLLALTSNFKGLMAATIVIGLCLSVGRATLLLLKANSDSPLWDWTLAFFLGLVSVSLITLTLSLAQMIYPLVLSSEILVLGLSSALVIIKEKPSPILVGSNSGLSNDRLLLSIPLGAMAVALALGGVKSLAPDFSVDTLNYHLAMPADFLAHGGYYAVGSYHSGYAHNIESVYLLALFLGAAPAAQLVAFTFTIATLSATYELGRFVGNSTVGLIAAALTATAPLSINAMPVAGTDWAVMFACVVTLRALLGWWNQPSFLAAGLTAVCFGSALSIKMSAVYLLLPTCIAFLILAFQSGKASSAIRSVLLFAAISIAFTLPYLMVNEYFLGNPFFPLMNNIFKSPYFKPDSGMGFYSQFGIGRDFFSLLTLPFTTITKNKFGDYWPRGALGISNLLALASIVYWRKWTPHLKLLAILAIGCGFMWGHFNQYLRFYTINIPLMSVIAATTIVLVWNDLKRQQSILWRAVLFLALAGIFLGQIPPAMWCGDCFVINDVPFRVAAGFDSWETYSKAKSPVFPAHQWLMAHATDGLIAGYDSLRYYSPPGKFFIVWEWPTLESGAQNANTIGPYFISKGVKYLAIPADSHETSCIQDPQFLKTLKIPYRDDHMIIYQLY